jgi:LmbE family N-acetylglucosaminyl deacetylase
MNSVIVVSTHLDDETLGCGGSLLRHKARGADIHWMLVTEPTSALGYDEYAQRQLGEAQESRAALEAKYPRQFKSYTEIESPYEALQYGAETLGELGPTALTALIRNDCFFDKLLCFFIGFC